jgi:hypothetical protein
VDNEVGDLLGRPDVQSGCRPGRRGGFAKEDRRQPLLPPSMCWPHLARVDPTAIIDGPS